MTATKPTCPACEGWGCLRENEVFFVMNVPCPECRGTGIAKEDTESERAAGSLKRAVMPPMALDATDWTTSCDFCSHQEGRHYCLLHSWTVKNMDMLRCKDWCEKLAV